MTMLRNFVCCERITIDGHFSLHNVHYAWMHPPGEVPFWMDFSNPGESDFSVFLQLYRGKALVDFTEEELIPAGYADVQTVLTLQTANLLRKTYTIVAVVNGAPASRLSLDFGAEHA